METKTAFTARYAETDQMGVVHHSNYPIWFEAGRTDFLKGFGISYSDIEAMGALLPLYELSCKFLSPAKYEDEIIVVTKIKTFTRVSMGFYYEVFNSKTNKLLATGETVHAWTDKNLKPVNAKKLIPDVYMMLSKKIDEKGE